MLSGVVVVDKPVGPTSFDVVRQARRATGVRKVGHGGTLDPLASGVLPICFGEATKLAQFLLDADKAYEATLRFGVETDSDDANGQVIHERSAEGVTAAAVAAALADFRGPQQQVPPIYSALKRAGRPLYDYARAGEAVAPPAPRLITVHALELLAFDGPFAVRLSLRCSKGTYVRALARDLGRALGSGAHLTALRRIRSGPFGLDRAIAPADLGGASLPLVSPADALAHLPTVRVAPELARALVQGKLVTWEAVGGPPPAPGPVRILDATGALVAVAAPPEPADVSPRLRTLRVFASAASATPLPAASVAAVAADRARPEADGQAD